MGKENTLDLLEIAHNLFSHLKLIKQMMQNNVLSKGSD